LGVNRIGMNQRQKSWLRRFAPRAIRPQRIWGGPLRGARLVTSWRDYPAAILGTTERPLLAWFAEQAKPGATWLDIGAHYGYTALALSRCVGASGRVYAFEPMLSTAGHLAETRRINGLSQLQVVPIALGEPATFELQRLPTVRGMVDSTLAAEAWSETILVARLDWLWPSISPADPVLHGVKIDVQGMELKVLRGMLGLLRQWQPKLVVELHAGVNREALQALLQEAGYLPDGRPIQALPGEQRPAYHDDRSYAFEPARLAAR
jgi:FkbM family methyltransferase